MAPHPVCTRTRRALARPAVLLAVLLLSGCTISLCGPASYTGYCEPGAYAGGNGGGGGGAGHGGGHAGGHGR
jgi:hypothetical protein